jgi:DNA repair protein RecN (Recombination protein N)
MLSRIAIRDFAIIDALELELGSGMTALTGETGAGKSILLDALGLVLGDRADAQTVRAGAKRAEISAEFDLTGLDHVADWLAEHELDDDGECLVRRTVNADGRSRGYVNGRAAPMAVLRQLGEQLVDIHGQHEHQSLLRREAQRQLLDHFGGLQAQVATVAHAYDAWRDAKQRRQQLVGDPDERAERRDRLRYQVRELDSLGLAEGEVEAMGAEQRRLANAGELAAAGQRALGALYDEEPSAHGRLSSAQADLERLSAYDPEAQTVVDMVSQALIQCDEAAGELRERVERIAMDPERLELVEQRLSAIHELARKHRVEPDELPALAERLRQELDELDHADEHAAELERELDERERAFGRAAEHLHAARVEAADRLSRAVTEAMQQLGMAGGQFEVRMTRRPDADPSPQGVDQVEFRVTANPGQPLASLRRVASGGELSRISLAIQMIGSVEAGIPTQIFDEVDAGIGGRVAAVVGEHLRRLGDHHQVLCVTHLPQVAANAHHHIQVTKAAASESTAAELRTLDPAERVDEIARMLGGRTITEQSRAHARELLAEP